MNLLQRGAEWLTEKMRAHASVTITYSRGAESVELLATKGRTSFEVEGRQVRIKSHVQDYLIDVADLVLGGAAAEPEPGDEIRETIAGVVHRFYVTPAADGQAFVWADEFKTRYRVHTGSLGTEP